MTIFNAVLMGIVQGVTEFVPVSSSGHLILVREFLGITTQADLAFDVMLHLATALAVLVYFRRDIWGLLSKPSEHKTLWGALILGTLPAVAIGVALEEYIVRYTRGAGVVAFALIVGSILFIVAEQLGKQDAILTKKKGFFVGCYQVLALVPGISRSGATISGGLLFGLTREQATRFAFLLSFPIILGAGVLKVFELLSSEVSRVFTTSLVSGGLVAFVVGLLAIHFMIQFLRNHSLYPFVVYRVLLALLVFFLL